MQRLEIKIDPLGESAGFLHHLLVVVVGSSLMNNAHMLIRCQSNSEFPVSSTMLLLCYL